jgi:hypothetical protein
MSHDTKIYLLLKYTPYNEDILEEQSAFLILASDGGD